LIAKRTVLGPIHLSIFMAAAFFEPTDLSTQQTMTITYVLIEANNPRTAIDTTSMNDLRLESLALLSANADIATVILMMPPAVNGMAASSVKVVEITIENTKTNIAAADKIR